jgi:hypothetical protein
MRTHQPSVPALCALSLRFEPFREGLGPSVVCIGAGLLRDPGPGGPGSGEGFPRGRGGPLSGPARMVRAAA